MHTDSRVVSAQTAGGGNALDPQYYSGRITTKTTTNVSTVDSYVSAIAINVSAAGTSQTLVIQDKAGTPLILYSAGAAIAVGNTYITFHTPVKMTGGIDIVTGGTTAGTQDIRITYWS